MADTGVAEKGRFYSLAVTIRCVFACRAGPAGVRMPAWRHEYQLWLPEPSLGWWCIKWWQEPQSNHSCYSILSRKEGKKIAGKIETEIQRFQVFSSGSSSQQDCRLLCVNGCSVRILVLTHGSETQPQAIQTQRENGATLLPQRCIAVAAQVSNSEVIHHHQDKIGLAALLKSHTAHLQEQQQRAGQPRRLHVVRTKALGETSQQISVECTDTADSPIAAKQLPHILSPPPTHCWCLWGWIRLLNMQERLIKFPLLGYKMKTVN